LSFPAPQPGLVIRYSYLWAREADAGRDGGVKDRPCAVLLATRDEEGDLKVIVLPVTHARPVDPDSAIEIPAPTKRRLGLDDDQSWIVVTECNVFAWPGPDLRFARGGSAESAAYGLLPRRLIEMVRERFLAMHEKANTRFVGRE
jgi:hypothetical protein